MTEVVHKPSQKADTIEPDEIQVGQWYWYTEPREEDDSDTVTHVDSYTDLDEETPKRWLGCVVHIGSNYVKLESPDRRDTRVHLDNFDRCQLEPNADSIIDTQVRAAQAEVMRLMGKVKEETARLAVSPTDNMPETQALARVGSGLSPKDYKTALVKAKEKTLPDLFQEIERTNKHLARWMSAKVIPFKAQAGGLKEVIKKIEGRIFNVELYAGLTEEVKQIADGEPAAVDEKVHLQQRRCYMDEECLARYETGGMDFKNIPAFEKWLLRPDNLERLLPYPRCVVAFQVRRLDKERRPASASFSEFIRIGQERDYDKYTFLYLRNGERIYRLRTAIEFDAKLFPDLDGAKLQRGKLYANMFCGEVRKLITEHEYLGMVEAYERKVRKYEAKEAAFKEALRSPEARARARAAGRKKPTEDDVDVERPWMSPHAEHTDYEPFDQGNVLYDDILAKVQGDLEKHNRIALVMQGLLDRSPVFQPHPQWEIWTQEGFEAALKLVYDDSRALPAGEKPDFDAYRKKLLRTLKLGDVTIGQQKVWLRKEQEKEEDRRRRSYRYRSSEVEVGSWWTPYGNEGPGFLARPTRITKTGKCTFEWERDRLKREFLGESETIPTKIIVDKDALFNVSAYKPGDFRMFFDDPRTRAEYLRWAPILLEAEEYHAGNRKVGSSSEHESEAGVTFSGDSK